MLLLGGLYRLVVRATPLAKVQIIQLLHNCILVILKACDQITELSEAPV